jgi:hypothetical protein
MVRSGDCPDRGGRVSGAIRKSNGKVLCRSCPRCNGYVGIVVREPGPTRRYKQSTAIVWGVATVSLGL